jgi:hypothetical protein
VLHPAKAAEDSRTPKPSALAKICGERLSRNGERVRLSSAALAHTPFVPLCDVIVVL